MKLTIPPSARKAHPPTNYWINISRCFEKMCILVTSPIPVPKMTNVTGRLDFTLWKQNTDKKEKNAQLNAPQNTQ